MSLGHHYGHYGECSLTHNIGQYYHHKKCYTPPKLVHTQFWDTPTFLSTLSMTLKGTHFESVISHLLICDARSFPSTGRCLRYFNKSPIRSLFVLQCYIHTETTHIQISKTSIYQHKGRHRNISSNG
jgi:hypothetical protein